MIEIQDLSVTYPRAPRAAVAHLDLKVAAGEVFGFIGPNGAGKTTTLKVLAGLIAPSSGRVKVAGHSVVLDAAAARAVVGYLPDSFGVYEDLTCREYLDFFAAAQGIELARRDAILAEVLALTDLESKADELAGALSRGMQQRLGLARVLVHEPSVLLLDEPSSGLDPRARIEVREVLKELGKMGRTVVLSSHVLADLAQVCTSVGIMEEGRLVYHGPVDEALRAGAAGALDATVLVEVLEGAEALAQALGSLEGAVCEPAGNGTLRVTLPLAGGNAEREAAASVARAVHAAGLNLVHLAAERVDLEHAFLHLTRGRVS